jgi:hypothetical protein
VTANSLTVFLAPGGGRRSTVPGHAQYYYNLCPTHRQLWRDGGISAADNHTQRCRPGLPTTVETRLHVGATRPTWRGDT